MASNASIGMSLQDEFKEAMRDIYKLSPLVGLKDQELLQSWVKCLAASGSGSGKDQGHALDYARYLAYQLQRKQLRFPFSQPPGNGPLPDLKEVLFGAGSAVDIVGALNTSCHTTSFRNRRERAFEQVADAAADDRTWDSHGSADAWHSHDADAAHWHSHGADPTGDRNVLLHLEELEDDVSPFSVRSGEALLTEARKGPNATQAPLWLLMTRVCPHARDGGALMHAVVAEELAEWSARLAAEQTADLEDGDGDDVWFTRAYRRTASWDEAQRALDDSKAEGRLADPVDMAVRLKQQSKQLQAEHAQLRALTAELEQMKKQLRQNQEWREGQFERQNRALQLEVDALKERITGNSKKMSNLKHITRDPHHEREKSSSRSHDSLNTSNGTNEIF